MDSIYVLIPVTTILLGLAIAAYLWSVNSGQFDDLDKAMATAPRWCSIILAI